MFIGGGLSGHIGKDMFLCGVAKSGWLWRENECVNRILDFVMSYDILFANTCFFK